MRFVLTSFPSVGRAPSLGWCRRGAVLLNPSFTQAMRIVTSFPSVNEDCCNLFPVSRQGAVLGLVQGVAACVAQFCAQQRLLSGHSLSVRQRHAQAFVRSLKYGALTVVQYCRSHQWVFFLYYWRVILILLTQAFVRSLKYGALTVVQYRRSHQWVFFL